jgi:branched-chain amino acid aminotransferase
VFFVFKNETVTPALNGSILPGGMRDSILQLLRHEGQVVSERRITMDEIVKRHKAGEILEAFGTGTAALISPIGELYFKNQSYPLNNLKVGPVSERLFTTIKGIQTGHSADIFGWMKQIEKP